MSAKISKFLIIPIIALPILFLLSCGKKAEPEKVVEEVPETEVVETKEVVLYTAERSPQLPYAKAKITFPSQEELLEYADVFVVIEVDNFELGVKTQTPRALEIANSEKGQHVHLIVDNEPYIAVYQQGEPINIGTIAPGPHTLIVFPSRSYHESVKTPGASNIINFYVGEPVGDFNLTEKTPSIIYSRPKGTYKGEAAKTIMLDFYLNNIELSPGGNTARYTITRKGIQNVAGDVYSIDINQWTPAFISGLSTGKYLVTLELLDKNGNLIPGGWNKTIREIEVITEEE